MRLTEADARGRLAGHDHAVLCTLHAGRGVDAVPVAFATDGAGHLGVPVDVVKPKASTRLQRERNLEADARATLLADRWDPDDWSRLWWVRAELRWVSVPPDALAAHLSSLLADRYPQYHDEPFARVLVFDVLAVTGWAAHEDAVAGE